MLWSNAATSPWVKQLSDVSSTVYLHTHSKIQHFHSQVQYSLNSYEKHTHSLERWKPGKNVGWQGRQRVDGQIKFPVSRRNRELGKTAVAYAPTNKQTKNKCTNIQVYIHTVRMFVCMIDCVRTERERISFTLVTTAAQECASDLCMCVGVYADSCRACS